MTDLDAHLAPLPERHKTALRWFAEHAAQTTSWPKPLDDGTLLVCRPKGIYKPKWSVYALSVRQSLDSTYADQDPVTEEDGRWFYRYFQESKDVTARDEEYTNRALMACIRDRIPVGVMIQTARKPRLRYRVLGIGLVEPWENGYFPIRQLGY